MKKIVWLDLEDTIIDDFTKGWRASPVNHVKVAKWLSQINPDEVRIFSFAISNSDDVKDYVRMFHFWLQKSLGVKIILDDIFTTEKLYYKVMSLGTFYDNERECMLMMGKDYGFQWWIQQHNYTECEMWLLDDVVEDKTIYYPGKDLKVNFVNVDHL